MWHWKLPCTFTIFVPQPLHCNGDDKAKKNLRKSGKSKVREKYGHSKIDLTCSHLLKPVGIDGNLSSPTLPSWLVFLFSRLSQTHGNPPQIGVVLLCYHPLQLLLLHRWWGWHLECIWLWFKIFKKAEHLREPADVDKELDAFVIFSLDTEARFGNYSQAWIFWGWKQRVELLHLTMLGNISWLLSSITLFRDFDWGNREAGNRLSSRGLSTCARQLTI